MNLEQDQLFEIISKLRTPAEAKRFFTDLCTPGELKALASRWKVVKLVDKGVAYREISQQTGASTATVTRVARSLSSGESGYRFMLDRTTSHKST